MAASEARAANPRVSLYPYASKPLRSEDATPETLCQTMIHLITSPIRRN
jgi:hypothetical protein